MNKINSTTGASNAAQGLHGITLADVFAWANANGRFSGDVVGDLLASRLDPQVITHED